MTQALYAMFKKFLLSPSTFLAFFMCCAFLTLGLGLWGTFVIPAGGSKKAKLLFEYKIINIPIYNEVIAGGNNTRPLVGTEGEPNRNDYRVFSGWFLQPLDRLAMLQMVSLGCIAASIVCHILSRREVNRERARSDKC